MNQRARQLIEAIDDDLSRYLESPEEFDLQYIEAIAVAATELRRITEPKKYKVFRDLMGVQTYVCLNCEKKFRSEHGAKAHSNLCTETIIYSVR